MVINKKISNFIVVNLINLILFISLLISSRLPYKYLIYLIIILAYSIYLFTQKSINIIKYQISFMLISSPCLDMLYLNTGKTIPMEIKYLIDIVLILLCFKMLINSREYKKVFNDSFIILIIMTILLNCIICIINKGNIYELFNGLRLYYRFIPVYIILSLNNFKFNTEYKLYYFLNIFACMFEILMKMHQDHINGLFGATGSPACSIFMTIMLVYIILKYINKKTKLLNLLFILFITFFYFVFSENKAFIFITCVNILFIILLSRGKKYKKILTSIITMFILIIGINVICVLFPNFGEMFKLDTMQQSIESYLLKNNNPAFALGRIDATKYVANIELNTSYRKMFGSGLGSALPTENWYYSSDMVSIGRYVLDSKPSTMLNRYGYDLGYQLTSTGVLFIETGYIGILVLLLTCIIFARRSLYIINNTKNEERYFIGVLGIVTIISSLFPLLYGGGLINRNLMFIILLILGRTSFVYKNVKYENYKTSRY